jgi:hypothetical protein
VDSTQLRKGTTAETQTLWVILLGQMRTKKIRGHKRRHRQIDKWRLDNLSIDLKEYLLNGRDRHYVKIRVHPWSGISVTKSLIPEPTRKTKRKMIKGLVDIYKNWKVQLDKLGRPFYLKVWFFEPRFSQSQVVCAIGDSVDFYKNTFFKPDNIKKLNPDKYGPSLELDKLTWDYHLDEDVYDNCTVGESSQYASPQDYEETEKWFKKILKKPHRTTKLKEPIGDVVELYSFRRGDLWLGEEK